eukprot:764856-Rhodomonas_salina.1
MERSNVETLHQSTRVLDTNNGNADGNGLKVVKLFYVLAQALVNVQHTVVRQNFIKLPESGNHDSTK